MTSKKKDIFDGESEELAALRSRKPTRKQIRYYHYLCRELGVPYEVAAQQLMTNYRTFGDIEVRIRNLVYMRNIQSLFNENRERVGKLLWALSRSIESETKKVIEREREVLAAKSIDDAGMDVKEEFKIPVSKQGESADGKSSIKRFLKKIRFYSIV